ncbi:MAG: class I SAM-dependent methyltransferase [Thermoplasmatota archaeon]
MQRNSEDPRTDHTTGAESSPDPDLLSETVNRAYSIFSSGGDLKKTAGSVRQVFDDKPVIDLVMDIVRTRKRSKEKFSRGEELFFTSEGLRWATPEAAAEHCAERIRGDLVADITCGQGGQALFFAKHSDTVIANDIDPVNTLITGMNAKAMGMDNIEVSTADCLSYDFVNSIPEGCAIFSDPARPPGSAERSFDEILPDPRRIVEIYGSRASGFCFEIPPHIQIDRIPFDCEMEFISIDGRINRLNIYLGDLKRSERSAVVLPERGRIEGTGEIIEYFDGENLPGGIAYEVDLSLVKSGLLPMLMRDLGSEGAVIGLDKRRTLLITDVEIRSPFLKKGHRILGRSTEEALVSDLKDISAGSVTLRWEMDPGDYWNVRKSIESELVGKRKVSLFRWKGYLLTERL